MEQDKEVRYEKEQPSADGHMYLTDPVPVYDARPKASTENSPASQAADSNSEPHESEKPTK